MKSVRDCDSHGRRIFLVQVDRHKLLPNDAARWQPGPRLFIVPDDGPLSLQEERAAVWLHIDQLLAAWVWAFTPAGRTSRPGYTDPRTFADFQKMLPYIYRELQAAHARLRDIDEGIPQPYVEGGDLSKLAVPKEYEIDCSIPQAASVESGSPGNPWDPSLYANS